MKIPGEVFEDIAIVQVPRSLSLLTFKMEQSKDVARSKSAGMY